LICLGQKFYSDATQETLSGGGDPNHMELQPHLLAIIVWNNLNLSNCCWQIDDEEKLIKEIIDKIKKLAQVPEQTWKGQSPNDLLGAGSQP
jgi:hypothetical protein